MSFHVLGVSCSPYVISDLLSMLQIHHFQPSLNFMHRPWFLFLMPSSPCCRGFLNISWGWTFSSLASDQCLLSFCPLVLWIIPFFHLYRHWHGIYRLRSTPLYIFYPLDYINVYDPISHPTHYWHHFCPVFFIVNFPLTPSALLHFTTAIINSNDSLIFFNLTLWKLYHSKRKIC